MDLLQRGDDRRRLGAAGEVDIDEGVADDAAAIDDEGRRQRDEAALIAMALGEIDAIAGEHLAIGGGGAEEHAELQAHRAVDIRQDLVAEAAGPAWYR